MLTKSVEEFASQNNLGVITTFRRGGAAQMSIVSCAPFGEGVAFTTTEDRAKLINLRRNPRCSLLVSQDDWWGFVVLEGEAKVQGADNTPAAELRDALREVYRRIAGEHPDWEEYDRAMVDERRAVVTVVPDHVYGTKA